MPPRAPVIALLSDRAGLRDSIVRQLAAYQVEPVLEVASDDKLLAAARKRRIDAAIIALESDEHARALARALREERPDLHIITLSTPAGDGEAFDGAALASGLVPALRDGDPRKPARWERMTERQRDVMRWLAIGLDNAAIGQKLRIGERAVKAHVSSLLELFQLDNRTQLALLADHAGLRPPGRH